MLDIWYKFHGHMSSSFRDLRGYYPLDASKLSKRVDAINRYWVFVLRELATEANEKAKVLLYFMRGDYKLPMFDL